MTKIVVLIALLASYELVRIDDMGNEHIIDTDLSLQACLNESSQIAQANSIIDDDMVLACRKSQEQNT